MPRLTKQKRILYEEMQKFDSFFNAEELHHKVAKKELALATIYRFLNTAEDTGEIHAFLCNNRKIYSLSTKNHIHFTCEKCNETKHVKIKNVDFLKENLPGKACHFQVDIKGVCEKCLENLKTYGTQKQKD